MWRELYEDKHEFILGVFHVYVKFNLHIGSKDMSNWYCSDATGHSYLDETNRKGYKTATGAKRAAEKYIRKLYDETH
jgi:hypothetical protein